jgi:hypothetical protein
MLFEFEMKSRHLSCRINYQYAIGDEDANSIRSEALVEAIMAVATD